MIGKEGAAQSTDPGVPAVQAPDGHEPLLGDELAVCATAKPLSSAAPHTLLRGGSG